MRGVRAPLPPALPHGHTAPCGPRRGVGAGRALCYFWCCSTKTGALGHPSALKLVAITGRNLKLAVLHYSEQSGSNSARGTREHRRAARCRAGVAEAPQVHQAQCLAESAQDGGKSLQQEVRCSFSPSVGQPKYIPPSKHILNLNPVSQQNALLISGEI